MYLRKIIVDGFKSFADKTAVVLARNHITGIVGPNGSGKSNIIDAVRWVMGEQNAKMLRGEKATDIIFSGSEKRTALAMAEVSLQFDNSEASPFCPPEYRHDPEITITRRIYGDGQREYLINRKTCRLKDILNFFAAASIGGRSYSMIQQGQVDRILQARPEELREIIEEAAGTAIYKRRKAEALKKLEFTRINLARLDDLMGELQERQTLLEKQVEAAKTWKELGDELATKEGELLTFRYRRLGERLGDLEKKMAEQLSTETTLAARLDELTARADELRTKLEEADPEIHDLNEEISQLRERLAAGESRLKALGEQLAGHDEREAELTGEGEKRREQLASAEAHLAEVEAKIQTEEETGQAQQEELDERTGEQERLEDHLQSLTDQAAEAARGLVATEKLIAKTAADRDSQEAELERLSEFGKGFDGRLATLEHDLSQLRIIAESSALKVSRQQHHADELIQQKNRLERTKIDLEEVRGRARDAVDAAHEEATRWRARVATLGELVAASDELAALKPRFREAALPGFDLSERVAFREKAPLPGTIAPVFERWAARWVITAGDLTAVSDWWQEEGRDELALCIIPEGPTPPPPAGLKPVAPHLTFEESDEALAAVIGRLYYAPDDGPLPPWEALGAGCVVFTAGGLIASGPLGATLAVPTSEGTITRRRQLADAEKETETADRGLQTTRRRLEGLDGELAETSAKLREGDAELLAANTELIAQVGASQSAQQRAEAKAEEVAALRERFSENQEAVDEREARLAEIYEALGRFQGEKEALAENSERIEEELTVHRSQRDEGGRILEKLRIHAASRGAALEALRHSRDQSQAQAEWAREALAKHEEQKERLAAGLESAIQQRQTLEAEAGELLARKEGCEELLATKKSRNAGLIEEIRAVETLLRKAQQDRAAAGRGVSEAEIDAEKLRGQQVHLREQAEERLGVDLAANPPAISEAFAEERWARRVQGLKERLRQFGQVNMMAIDEYDALTERLTFMGRQHEEVAAAAQLLEVAIEETEEHSTERFRETFVALAREFTALFPILFPLGEARLHLTDEEKPLEAGVEILVRLPGKKMQSMRLFSGGEKALTAIALIFALLKSNPTPFCFLDEVDAALDETNVTRYNRVLELLSDHFQFIVITHRRRTMEVLDTLYGVTMQEPGVSSMVGVDLGSSLPTHLQKSFRREGPSASRQGASAG